MFNKVVFASALLFAAAKAQPMNEQDDTDAPWDEDTDATLTDFFTEAFIEDSWGGDYDESHHENPWCGDSPWITTELSCDYFDIEYQYDCSIEYSHDPCDMSNNYCFNPYFDMDGNYNYECHLDNYENWLWLREFPVWHDQEVGHQLPYVHEYWDDYHGIVDSTWWDEAWGYDELHENPQCGETPWVTTTLSCDYFPEIEYQAEYGCGIEYSNDPCDMSNYWCYAPYWDMNDTYNYECFLYDYDTWMSLRDAPVWHDTSVGQQLPYIHEHWDTYHGVYDASWWNEAWGYEDADLEYLYDDYEYFKETCYDGAECEWYDCEENEIYTSDCWKELCYGCDMYVCQLWHWNERSDEWDLEDCQQEYLEWDEDQYEVEDFIEEAGSLAGTFNTTIGEGQERLCGNFSCVNMLGAAVAEWLDANNETLEMATSTADEVLENEDFEALAGAALFDATEGELIEIDEDYYDAFEDIDSVGSFDDLAEDLAGDAVDASMMPPGQEEEMGWWGQAVDAFWSGFLGY